MAWQRSGVRSPSAPSRFSTDAREMRTLPRTAFRLTRHGPACESRVVSSAGEMTPAAELRRLLNGYQVSQAVHVAVVLGVPELLAGGPRTPAELAPAAGADRDALRRLLRALAAVG